jgi:hypothetical protein
MTTRGWVAVAACVIGSCLPVGSFYLLQMMLRAVKYHGGITMMPGRYADRMASIY